MNILGIVATIVCLMIAVVVGSKKKINIGLMALPFAYLLLVFIQGQKASTILTYWPVSLCGQVIAVMFFYGFAVESGVMKWMAQYCTYFIRKTPWMLPLLAGFLSFAVTACGVFPVLIYPMLLPILFAVADQLNYSKFKIVLFISTASWLGTWTPAAMGFAMVKTYMGIFMPNLTAEEIAATTAEAIKINVVLSFVIFIFYFIVLRAWKVSIPEGMTAEEVFAKPQPLTGKQKPMLVIFIITIAMLFLPSILAKLLPLSGLTWFAGCLDASEIFFTAGIVCALFGICDTNAIIHKLPWNLCLMLFGVTALFQALSGFGLYELLSSLITENIPMVLAVVVIFVIGALVNMVSDGMAVVIPLLMPVVWTLFSVTGLPLSLGVHAVFTCTNITGICPTSSGGAMVMGVAPEEERDKLSKTLLQFCFIQIIVYSIVYLVIATVMR